MVQIKQAHCLDLECGVFLEATFLPSSQEIDLPLVFIDASSAILLYKIDLFSLCAQTFTIVMAEAVLEEITIPGYPGAGYFNQMKKEQKIQVLGPISGQKNIQMGVPRLDKGELETLLLFLNRPIREGFVIMDDRNGARYCRDQDIPFINALLVPKIFWYAGRMDTQIYTKKTSLLTKVGRYSKTIVETAKSLSRKDLECFIPHED